MTEPLVADGGVLIVRSRPGGPLDAERFERWYLDEHFPDVLADPVVQSAELFRELDGTRIDEHRTDGASGGLEYVAIYRVVGDPRRATDSIRERMLAMAASGGLPDGYDFLGRVAFEHLGGKRALRR